MRFVKKPVVVEATQWWKTGDHPDDCVGMEVPDGNGGVYMRVEGAVVRFYRHPGVPGATPCKHCGQRMHDHGWIDTREGGHTVCPGDWIITGIAGERYSCKPKIFEATYDPVQEQSA